MDTTQTNEDNVSVHEETREVDVQSPVDQSSNSYHEPPAPQKWQKEAKGIDDRLAYMLEFGAFSDVTFLVGLSDETAEDILGHRCILKAGSAVFEELLTDDHADRDGSIRVSDVDPKAFRNVLRFIYMDKVGVDGETVIGTMYAAVKFDLPILREACDRFLKQNVTAENCLRWFMQFQSYGHVDLAATYAKHIDRFASDVLKSAVFAEIDHDMLSMLLARDTLVAPEIDIFNAVERWARAQCARQELEPHGENMRRVLGDAVYLVRYPRMSAEEIVRGPAMAGWLSGDEVKELMQYLFAKTALSEQFNKTDRRTDEMRIRRFGEEKVSRISFPVRPDFVGFSVQRPVKLTGVSIYGPGVEDPKDPKEAVILLRVYKQIEPIPAPAVQRPNGGGRRDSHGQSPDLYVAPAARKEPEGRLTYVIVAEQKYTLMLSGCRMEPVIIKLALERPLDLEPEANYVLYARIPVERAWGGEKGQQLITMQEGHAVCFWAAKIPDGGTESNGTNQHVGQFPEMFFSPIEQGAGDAKATVAPPTQPARSRW